jgi:hypothetical protein
MPGDPKECRTHAARCAAMAAAARTPYLKATFLELSKNWEKLAIQLENAFAQLAESQDNRSNVQSLSTRLAGFGKRYIEDYTTFDRSGHLAPHWSFKLRARFRGQSAVISSDQSNSLASMP